MKNLGRKSINLSLDLVVIATGVLSILNFFKKKPNGKKDNLCDGTGMVRSLQDDASRDQTSREPPRLDFRDPGYRRGPCYCGQPGCEQPANDNTDGK